MIVKERSSFTSRSVLCWYFLAAVGFVKNEVGEVCLKMRLTYRACCCDILNTLNDCFICFQSFLLTCSLGSQWSCWEWWHCVVNQNLSQNHIIFSCKNKKTNPGTCGGALECWQSNIYAVLNYLCTPVLPWFSQPKNKRTAVWFISTDRVYLSHTRSLWSLEKSEDQKGLGLGGKLAKAHLFLCGVPGCGHLWCRQPDQELAPIERCSDYVFL